MKKCYEKWEQRDSCSTPSGRDNGDFLVIWLREDSGMERHVIVTELDGKSAKGRPRMKMLDWMKRRLNVRREEDMMDVARDRQRWKRTFHDSSTA